jgi:hypothetical protein
MLIFSYLLLGPVRLSPFRSRNINYNFIFQIADGETKDIVTDG